MITKLELFTLLLCVFALSLNNDAADRYNQAININLTSTLLLIYLTRLFLYIGSFITEKIDLKHNFY